MLFGEVVYGVLVLFIKIEGLTLKSDNPRYGGAEFSGVRSEMKSVE